MVTRALPILSLVLALTPPILAACDSAGEPSGPIVVTVTAAPEVARLRVDTVVVTKTVLNLRSEAILIGGATEELRRVPSGERVIRIGTGGGAVEIAAGDSLRSTSRYFGALDQPGMYEVIYSLNDLEAAGRDTFEVVQ